MILFCTGRAQVIDFHEDIEIRSPNDSFRLPKVLRLFQKVNQLAQVKFSRGNVFYRDKNTCQYCYESFKEKELTLDHVLPKSRGGKTSWDNIVTCCYPCNNKKADKTPHECGFKLLRPAKMPKWSPAFAFRLSHSEQGLFHEWFFAQKSA